MAKDIIWTKQQTIYWEKIFTNYTSDRELIPKIYKKLKSWTPRKQCN